MHLEILCAYLFSKQIFFRYESSFSKCASFGCLIIPLHHKSYPMYNIQKICVAYSISSLAETRVRAPSFSMEVDL